MILNINEIIYVLKKLNININGVLHIGAHNCEEIPIYQKMNIKDGK